MLADLPVRTTYRRLMARGLSCSEAGNLTARLAGLHTTVRPWTPREIDGVLYVRWLVEHGRIGKESCK